MAMEKEALTNTIESDLARRNRNWDKIEFFMQGQNKYRPQTNSEALSMYPDNCIELVFTPAPDFQVVYNAPIKMLINPDGKVSITGKIRRISANQTSLNTMATLEQPKLVVNGAKYQTTKFDNVRSRTGLPVEEAKIRIGGVATWTPSDSYVTISPRIERNTSGDFELKINDHSIMPVGSEAYFANETYWEYFDQSKITNQIISKCANIDESNFNFIFAPDMHFAVYDTRHDVGMKYVNRARSFCNMPLITPGDILKNYNKAITKNGIRKAINLLGSNFFYTPGNHDQNSYYSKAATAVIFKNELRELILDKMNPLGFEITFSEDSLCYYADDPVRKVRLIFIDTHESDETVLNGNIREPTFNTGYINQKQLEFVAFEALDLKNQKNDYASWHVAFFSHYPLHHGGTKAHTNETTVNGEQMWTIIQAFKNRMSVTIPKVTRSNPVHSLSGLTKSFVAQYEIPIIGYFYGHYHNDQHQIIDGVNFICSECFSSVNFNTNWEQVSRQVFSYDEFAFDVVTVLKNERKVILKRIGNDSLGDREYTY
jgi:hypothetical protein